jgi:hypothetical protein
VWKVGDKVTVTWRVSFNNLHIKTRVNDVGRDVSSMPTVTRPTGTVLLGFLTADSENLMIGELSLFFAQLHWLCSM